MGSFRSLHNALIVCLFSSLYSLVYGSIVIDRVDREVGVLPSKLLQRAALTIRHDGRRGDDIDVFKFCGRKEDMEASAVIQIGEVDKDKGEEVKEDLVYRGISEDTSIPEGIMCYEYDFPSPLKKKETRTLLTMQISTNHLVASPKERKQSESPKVEVTVPGAFIAGYPIGEEETTIILTTARDIESYTGKREYTQEKQKVLFDSVKKLAPYDGAKDIVRMRISMRQGLLRAKTVEKDVYVSPWGGVRVKEVFDIKNDASLIRGEFSRLDLMLLGDSGAAGAALSFSAKIPGSAYDIRFRDEIGNISTSEITSAKEWKKLLLQPRYPVFGGWSTSFILEYSLDIPSVTMSKKGGSHTLAFTSVPSIVDLVYDEIHTTIHLPEGSHLVGDAFLSQEHTQSVSKEYTYFDVLGRPVISIGQKNVVPEMMTLIEVTYSFSDILSYEKPVLMGGSVVALAILVKAILSIDLGPAQGQKATKVD